MTHDVQDAETSDRGHRGPRPRALHEAAHDPPDRVFEEWTAAARSLMFGQEDKRPLLSAPDDLDRADAPFGQGCVVCATQTGGYHVVLGQYGDEREVPPEDFCRHLNR